MYDVIVIKNHVHDFVIFNFETFLLDTNLIGKVQVESNENENYN